MNHHFETLNFLVQFSFLMPMHTAGNTAGGYSGATMLEKAHIFCLLQSLYQPELAPNFLQTGEEVKNSDRCRKKTYGTL
jgi:hypothetical protein